MLRTKFASPGLTLLLCQALVGCLITTGNASDEDDSADDTGTSDPSASSFTSSDTMSATSVDPDGTGDDTVGETTGTPMGECTESLIADGGFEGGTPSQAWTEMSTNFGTPICDTACTEDAGADPYAGDWYAWFGGIDTDPEIASVSQSLNIGGETAFLSFRFQINAAAGSGDDFFEVTVDDTTVFLALDTDMPEYDGYTPISVDISDFADGNGHTITFTGDFLGNELTNFFLDEVALVTCVSGSDTTGTSEGTTDTGSSSDTTAADSSSGSDSGSDSGGSSGTDASSSGSSSGM